MAGLDPETIRILRLSRRMSQKELGEKVGMAQEKISLFERGLQPKPEEVEKLLNALSGDAA